MNFKKNVKVGFAVISRNPDQVHSLMVKVLLTSFVPTNQ